MAQSGTNKKWNDYFFCEGSRNFEYFWKKYLVSSEKNLLFIIGIGFDPRMNLGIKRIINCGNWHGKCICLKLDEGDKSPFNDYKDRINKNCEELKQSFKGIGALDLRPIKMWSEDGRLIGDRNAAKTIKIDDISGYSDIIVDISSSPRIIFIPLIARILSVLKNYNVKTNLHIIVAENFALDEKIMSDGLKEEAITIHGFGGLDNQNYTDKPKVWLPILGGGQNKKLMKINDLINPNEICPILPFPSRNPRRIDDLIIEYKDFFFENPGVEPNNIIYVDEQNPFEVYQQIYHTAKQYEEALAPLGGCNIIVSPLSSKLLSVGALLAAIELNLSLTEVPALGYNILEDFDSEIGKEELFELWLYGEPYE